MLALAAGCTGQSAGEEAGANVVATVREGPEVAAKALDLALDEAAGATISEALRDGSYVVTPQSWGSKGVNIATTVLLAQRATSDGRVEYDLHHYAMDVEDEWWVHAQRTAQLCVRVSAGFQPRTPATVEQKACPANVSPQGKTEVELSAS